MATLDAAAVRRAVSSAIKEESGGGPQFDGTGDYFSWKREAQLKLITREWTGTTDEQNQKKANMLIKWITGPAMIVLLAGKTDAEILAGPFSTPTEVFTPLTARYGVEQERRQREGREQLMRLRQGAQDFNTYMLKFDDLAGRWGCDEATRISAFRAGTDIKFLEWLGPKECTSFATMQQDYLQWERMFKSRNQGPRQGKGRGRGVHGDPMDVDQTASENKRGNKGKRLQNMSREELIEKGITCHICNKIGHLRKTCPNKGKGRKVKDDEGDTEVEELQYESEKE